MGKEDNLYTQLMELFKEQPKLITANSVGLYTNEADDKLVPTVDGLVLIDARCGKRSIVQHGEITKKIIISQNMIRFNGVYYAAIIIIQENEKTKQRRTFNALFNAKVLAIRSGDEDQPIEVVGNDAKIITNLKNHIAINYHSTTTQNVFVRQEYHCDLASNLRYQINDNGVEVIATANKPSTPTSQ